MVRAPCCEKVGLKKGPWTPEEDQILINYIQQHGHGNWRALPKHAGLLRCGKSCRLRWTNYLRPDIKRGNFTREEEDTIIQLHEMLGNRWSAIAARLPGRTDNEIKNVWHTHLKKRLKKIQPTDDLSRNNNNKESKIINNEGDGMECRSISPQQCSSDISSLTTADDISNNNSSNNNTSIKIESLDDFPEIDENFWSEVLSSDDSSSSSNFPVAVSGDSEFQIPFFPVGNAMESVQVACNSSTYDSMEFWYNLLTRSGESLPELPQV